MQFATAFEVEIEETSGSVIVEDDGTVRLREYCTEGWVRGVVE